jgi:copper chaperone CopZ
MIRFPIFLVLFMFLQLTARAQQDTVFIKTSAVCKTCKKKIEGDISFEKGVKKVNLDLNTKVLMVVYDSRKTSPEKLRLAVTQTGYDADTIPRNPKAFKRLPDCCKEEQEHHP